MMSPTYGPARFRRQHDWSCYVAAVCSSFNYGLSQRFGNSSADVPLAAHEIGHNLGAEHDDCSSGQEFVMCPFLINNVETFSSQSRNVISSVVNSSSCLDLEDTGGGDNKAPVLSAIGPQTVTEGNTLNITLSASDEDGDPLSFSNSQLSGSSLNGASFSYTPAAGTVPAGQTALDVSVTFTVTDGELSDAETVVITVNSASAGNQPQS